VVDIVALLWVVAMAYVYWRVLAGFAREPGPVGNVSRWRAFKKLFLFLLPVYFAGFTLLIVFIPVADRVASVAGMALLSALFAFLPAASLTVRGWQFRSLLRWMRKRLGVPIGP
jgi:hypothetical protein